GTQLAVRRRRLFPPLAVRHLGGGDERRPPRRRQTLHLLLPSLGDRSRSAVPARAFAEEPGASLHQSATHGGKIAPRAARFPLGPHGPRARRPTAALNSETAKDR